MLLIFPCCFHVMHFSGKNQEPPGIRNTGRSFRNMYGLGGSGFVLKREEIGVLTDIDATAEILGYICFQLARTIEFFDQ